MTEPSPATDPLLDLLAGKARAQAVSTAARLGIADALDPDDRSTAELAATLDCDPERLETLLRVLAGLGVLACPEPARWRLTALGAGLKRDALGPLAAFVGAPEHWDPWSRLDTAVRGGTSAFERTFGRDLYAALAADPSIAARYDAAIDAFTNHEVEALCATYDFSAAREVLDVGGGRGTLLANILRHHPTVRGTLFDLPHVVHNAAPALREEFGERVTTVGGDFLETLPDGADHLLIKHVLHNWPDRVAVQILERARQAMAQGGRVLVIDAVRLPGPSADIAALLDLEMLVLTGGRQRRKPELRRLIQAAGLRILEVRPLASTGWLFVAAAAAD